MQERIKGSIVKIALLFLCCLCTAVTLRGQYYLSGEDPARLKWNQINVGSIKLIYPQGLDSLAFRYAYLMEHVGGRSLQSLNAEMPRFPVVLHPYDLQSNGLVVWTPKRMELETTPPSEDGNAQSWERQLVLHEMRHIAQMQRAGENVFKPLSWFIGEHAEGIAVGLYFPTWLLEGDATMEETLLSSAGRGRQASFLMPYRAYYADSIQFSVDKWANGSYTHKIPNKYANGYFRLSSTRPYHSEDALDQIFTRITKRPYWPFVFRQSFRDYLGAPAIRLWENAWNTYVPLWKEQELSKVPFDEGESLSPTPQKYAEYRSPIVIKDSSGNSRVYAKQWSLEQTSRLVCLPNDSLSKPKVLRLLGDVNSRLSTDNRSIYWSEQVSGYRWDHENFSVIRRYDIATGLTTTLTHKSRYFNPVPHPKEARLAVVHYPVKGGSELHIISSYDGILFERYPVPGAMQLSSLDWLNSHVLVGALTGTDGKGLYSFDLDSGKWTQITPAGYSMGSTVKVASGRVFFENDHSGIDNICAVSVDENGFAQGEVERLTEARFGAFDPFMDSDSLYYSRYTSKGYQINRLPADSLLSLAVDVTAVNSAGPVSQMKSTFNIDTVRVPDHLSYNTSRYRKFPGVFHVHSWMPFYFNADALDVATFQTYYQVVSLGASVMAQNTLGTAVTHVGYRYYKGFHSAHLKYTFSGWLPVITAEVHLNERTSTSSSIDMTGLSPGSYTDTTETPYLQAKLYTYIPFTFNSGGWNRGLVPSLRYQFTNDQYSAKMDQDPVYRQLLQFGLQYYQMRDKAQKDIFPRLGFGLNAQYALAPKSRSHFTEIGYAQAYAYLPGILKNQALKITAAYQEQISNSSAFYLGSFITVPRGIQSFYANKIYTLTADYAIPIAFNDVTVGPLLYIQRMQLIPFADYMHIIGTANGHKPSYASVGADVLFDFNLFRIGTQISAGVRYAYSSDKHHTFEALFSIPAIK